MTLMYSGSRGSLRTQNERDHLDLMYYMTFTYSGPKGSLGTQNVPNWFDRHMVHLVALMAHGGPRKLGMARYT